MKISLWGLVLISFTFGILVAPLLEQPQLPRSPLGAERASPQDWISQDQITVLPDEGVYLDVQGAMWATFADTNSMDPVLDKGTHGIQLKPERPEDLQVGDIITYDYNGQKIIHRIVEIGQDANGYYFIVKGDNNPLPDPQPVYWDQVERVLIGVFW